MRQVYAGVMSGTSLDGVDAVIADFAPEAGRVCRLLGAAQVPFAQPLRNELLALQRALRLSRVVIVQPSVYGSDNSCTLDGMRRLGPAWADVAG